MKAVKIALFSLLGLVLLLVVAVAVLSLPAIQRKVASRFMATEPGESVEIGYLHVGFNRTEVRDMQFRQAGAAYSVGELTADLSLFDVLFRREARLGDVVASGLVIDLSEMEPQEEPEPFEGILRQMKLPMPLYLDTLQAEGVLLLPPLGNEPMRSDFVLTGEGFAPGREGELHLNGDLQSSAGGRFSALGVEGDLTILQAERGRIERARLLAWVAAAGAGNETEESLRADILLLATDDGESYQARFHRVAGEEVQERNLSTLIVIDATYLHDEGLLEGSWEIDLDRDQLLAYVGQLELPAFEAQGDGQFSYGVAGGVFDVQGQLNLAVSDLAQVAEELRELGGFTLESRFNLAMDETAFRLEEFVLELRDEEERNLLEARNHQRIRYDRLAERLEGVEERLDLAEVTIHALPVEWANLFLGTGQQEQLVVRGSDLTGQLLVSAEAGGMFFRLGEPLRGGGIALLSENDPLLEDLAFELGGSGSFEDGRFAVTLDPLRLMHRDQPLALATGEFDSVAGHFRGDLRADLANVLAQPALADYRNLAEGILDLELLVNFQGPVELEANGSIRDLVTLQQRERLPRVVFEALLRQTGEEAWGIHLPVRVEGRQSSDVLLEGQIATAGEVNRFDLRLSGEQLVADHFTALASAFTAPENGAQPSGERDEEPLWTGLEGQIAVEIAEVQLHEDYGLEGLQGDLTVQADSVTNSLRATMLDSPVEVDLRLRFLQAEERPYVLDGAIEAPQLAAGELFRRLQPNRPPTVEGLFAVSMEIQGTGRNLPDLLDRVRGEARLRSGGGIIRLFYTENPLAGLGFAAGNLLGALGGDVGAISQVATRLSHMPFDEMNILAERDEDLNFVLRDLTVLSPEMHLRGTGEVRYREGVEVLEQPMEINLSLGARGPLERALAAARALSEERDELGYRQMRRDFSITGTPADPDASPFYRLLVDTVLRFVRPEEGEGEEEERERRGIPEIPDVFDFLRGIRGR